MPPKTKITLSHLSSFTEDQEVSKNYKALQVLGGLEGVVRDLRADVVKGIIGTEEDVATRKETYGENTYPEPESASFLELFLESFYDSTVIVLMISAGVSLVVGMYENMATGWIEGVAILAAVVIVAVVTAVNNYMKEIQFRKLNQVNDDISVGVVRGGQVLSLSIKEIVVGDLVRLNAGDKIPADGIMVSGSDVTCNESSLTGESDDLFKTSGFNCDKDEDPFLLSGATLSSGYCHMLVCAVGSHSKWGKIKENLSTEKAETPLQEKLTELADQIGYVGMGAAVATFVAMMVIWFLYPDSRAADVTLLDYVIQAFIMGVTIVVVAVPEGLPLAVTLSLAFSTQKMMSDNNLIRVLSACETMGNATNICSDKTGTLTQNKMTVVESFLGGKKYNHTASGVEWKKLNEKLLANIREGIAVNTTAVVIHHEDKMVPDIVGNKTEGALLMMLTTEVEGGQDYLSIRSEGFDTHRGDKLMTFTSHRKCMSVLQNLPQEHRVLVKGAAEVVLGKCVSVMDANGEEVAMDKKRYKELADVISDMAQRSLRVVALAHRSIHKDERRTRASGPDASEMSESELEDQLVLDALFGIKDPLRDDVIEAVKTCQQAGIFVRMVTGDNLETAVAIAKECGILVPGGQYIEGPEFRELTPKQLDELLPTLQVLARSSPKDKLLLVTRLNGFNLPETEEEWLVQHPGCDWNTQRDLLLPGWAGEWKDRCGGGMPGEVVGVTGDGTNDGPALNAADVGLSMGISGTDVAKDASDIVILDDNFASIVKSVMWGRSVFDNIRKFLQFQLTVNLVALTLTFISAVTGYRPPLNAVMMLWVNLIMDTMGALALGTETPFPSLLQRRPYRRDASLISVTMWRNILIQFLFQMVLLGYLLIIGAEDFDTTSGSATHFTVIFNVFVFAQIFNEFNARSIDNNPDILKGLLNNKLFLGIFIVTCATQYALVEYGGDFVRTVPLSHENWIKCILLGSLALPLGGLMRLVPVSENENQLAPLPPLLKDRVKSSQPKKESAGLTFLLWLVIVTLIPALVYSRFGALWSVHWNTYISK